MQNGYELDISLRRLCNVKTTGRRDAPTPVVTDRQMWNRNLKLIK